MKCMFFEFLRIKQLREKEVFFLLLSFSLDRGVTVSSGRSFSTCYVREKVTESQRD